MAVVNAMIKLKDRNYDELLSKGERSDLGKGYTSADRPSSHEITTESRRCDEQVMILWPLHLYTRLRTK